MLIKIKNLEIACNIGIYEWEHNFMRQLIINIDIECPDEASSYSDNIHDTIDYEQIYNGVKNIVAQKRYNLIEALARDIIEMVAKFPKVSWVQVAIDKMKIFEDVDSCAVVLQKKLLP